MKKKHFFKRWPTIEVACEPDNIKWFNLGTNARSRRMRACLIWFIAILLICASLIGIVFMKEKTDELKKKFNTDFVCPDGVTKEVAWEDQIKPEDKRIGLMHCYCIEQAKVNTKGFLDISFDTKEFNNDKTKYCNKWAINYAIQKSMVVGTALVVTVINIVTNTIFEKIVFVEKKHTINDETSGQFTKILLMQFINIAVVILVVNMQLV